MKKILLTLISLAAVAFANVLIEDFEDDDKVSLLSDQDYWFVYTDSADAGCQTVDWDFWEPIYSEYPRACSEFNTIFVDGAFSNWTFEPRTFVYEDSTGEEQDTSIYFPLRSKSPLTAEELKAGGPEVQYLESNDSWVGGLYYEFGPSMLMMQKGPYDPYYEDYDAAPSYWFVPYVAFGLKTVGNGVDYDLSKCTGISYRFRGEGHRFRADLSTVKDNNYHYIEVNPSRVITTVTHAAGYQGYETVEIKWSQLSQESWGVKKTFNASQITQLIWELRGGNLDNVPHGEKNTNNLFEKSIVGISSDIGDLVIDDVTCLTTLDSIPVGAISSSSAPKSSSSKAKSSSSKAKSSSSKKQDDKDALPGYVVLESAISAQVHVDGIQLKSEFSTKVDFFDHVGRRVGKTALLPVGSHFIPFKNLAKGMYIARIQYRGHSRSVKFLVK